LDGSTLGVKRPESVGSHFFSWMGPITSSIQTAIKVQRRVRTEIVGQPAGPEPRADKVDITLGGECREQLKRILSLPTGSLCGVVFVNPSRDCGCYTGSAKHGEWVVDKVGLQSLLERRIVTPDGR
jgi:hypothetical protein